MANAKQLLGLLVVVLCTGVASAQGAAPLPPSEVAAIFSIRQKWLGNPVVYTWNGQDPCNLWNGVVCFQDPFTGSNNIVGLSLANANVPGPIPPEVGNFSRLNSLVLTNNRFTGTIPPELSSLFYLKKMLLNNNQLTGGIPREFGLLPGLTILNIDNNQLTEPLPVEVFTITELRQFSVENNQLSGSIPGQLLGAINLQALNLKSNRLNGSIPTLLGNLTQLQSIDLSSNSLTGTIPASLGNLQTLTFLSLANNRLSGQIPLALANVLSLQSLWLFNNTLTGTIPSQLQFVPDFRAFGNRLTAPAPASAPSPGQLLPGAPAAVCSPGTSVACACPQDAGGVANTGLQYCNGNGSARSSCICQPQQCRTCPLGQTARPVPAGAACPSECLTPLVVLLRIVNLTMADFDNATATQFRSVLAQQLSLSLDQVALLQIAPGSVIATVGFLPPSNANATSLDPQISSRIATALLSQSVNLGAAFTPYQTLTVLPTVDTTTPGPTPIPAAPVVVRVNQTNWPWVVALLVLSIALLIGVCAIVAWCFLTGRCAPPARHGPSPPHSRRFQPLLTNDPDSLALRGASQKTSRALAVRPPLMPYVDMPPSRSRSHSSNPLLEQRYSEPRSGPVSGAKRLVEAEREPHSWSPAGVNEPPQRANVGKSLFQEGIRRTGEEVAFEPPIRKVPVKITSFPPPEAPGRPTTDLAVPASIGMTQLGGQLAGPSFLNQPAMRPAVTTPPESAVLSNVGAKEIPLAVLQTATDNFSEANWVGTGGFGLVYRGVLPVSQCPEKVRGKKPTQDLEVAVKVLDVDTTLSDQRFKTQMELLGRLKHKYLVELIGYCMEGNVRMLVYEFMAFGSLADHLHGPRPGQPQFHHLVELTWRQRMRIAYGSARGLNYLHTPEAPAGSSPLVSPFPGRKKKPIVVHRDLSTSNILLDDNMQVRVVDFGLAPLMLTSPSEAGDSAGKRRDADETPTPSEVATPAHRSALASPGMRSGAASEGYASPASPSVGWTSPKSDVFAFGIVLLELITGSPPLDETRSESQQHIIAWAKPHLANRETLTEIVDPKLGNRAPLVELYQVAAVISMCIQPDETVRPPMSTVVQMLAPLSEAPDPDAPSESGRPESGWSGSSGTGTDRGAESSGSFRSRGFGRGTDFGSGRGGGPFPPGGGGPFPPGAGGGVVRPLIMTRPAGYQEYVTPENAEGLHPVHMSPEIRPADRPTNLWSVRMPEYRIPVEVLEQVARSRDARAEKEKEPWFRRERKGKPRPPSNSSSESSSSDRTDQLTPDSVLRGSWSRPPQRKHGSHQQGSQNPAPVGPIADVSRAHTSVSMTFAPESEPSTDFDGRERLLDDVPEDSGGFVDQPRGNRTVGTPPGSHSPGSRSRGDESPGKRKRGPENSADRRARVRSKSQGS
ncbi:L domain-like protein kinase superfamily [Klebsormidium nitens]|uniref:non-specific serine/threonine protein kinase n=1 Tax=Klebsormidium nitens TaxID=105231 RepID=A0A1Y1HQ47_KLENI|nr:L domain-like protein kinase superfamily [Klebsormidium nitens]|eukprot:GAQ78697.1 L domain-like protein kinase superfamily [Klebsormidium nitens]